MAQKLTKAKKSKKKVEPLFESDVDQTKLRKIQKKLDKKEAEQDKVLEKEFIKSLKKMDLVEVDYYDPVYANIREDIRKLSQAGKAEWHHYSCGKHYYKIKQ